MNVNSPKKYIKNAIPRARNPLPKILLGRVLDFLSNLKPKLLTTIIDKIPHVSSPIRKRMSFLPVLLRLSVWNKYHQFNSIVFLYVRCTIFHLLCRKEQNIIFEGHFGSDSVSWYLTFVNNLPKYHEGCFSFLFSMESALGVKNSTIRISTIIAAMSKIFRYFSQPKRKPTF